MLSKRYRNFLNVVSSLKPDIRGFSDCYSYGLIERATNFSDSDVTSICAYLEQNEYVGIVHVGDLPNGIWLLEKAKHYKEFSRREVVQFVFRSILIPVVVAVITSIAIQSVQWWPKIVEALLQQPPV